jgi:hypothetical protein
MKGCTQAIAMVLLAAAVVSCDGLIGLTDPSVALQDADTADTELPDVGEPDDAGETSTEDASAEAGDDDVVIAPNDAGDAASTQADSTVPFPDAAVAPDATCPTGADTCATTGVDATTPPGPDSAAVAPATVILLNSSPDLPSVRVCLVVAGTATTAILPVPDRLAPGQTVPGIDLWTGAPIPTGLGDPATLSVTPYLLRVDAIARAAEAGVMDCLGLIGPGGEGMTLVAGVDFWRLPTVPAGTFIDGTVGFVMFHGCLPLSLDPNASIDRCGQDYDGGNNLQYTLYSFTPISGFAARVIQGSRPIDGVFAEQAGGTVSEIVSFDGEQVTGMTFKSFDTWFPLLPATSSLNVEVVTDADAEVATYAWPWTEIAQITTGSSTTADGGPYYAFGQTYTFVIVGDPSAPADSGAQPHAIVFPDDLVPPAYP